MGQGKTYTSAQVQREAAGCTYPAWCAARRTGTTTIRSVYGTVAETSAENALSTPLESTDVTT